MREDDVARGGPKPPDEGATREPRAGGPPAGADAEALWSARGELPADLARLQADLARLELPPEPDWSRLERRRASDSVWRWWLARRAPRLAWAAAAALTLVAAGVVERWLVRDAWRVEAVEGRARLGGPALGARLAVGGSCTTDEGSRVRVEVKGLGQVDLAPGSSLRRVPGRRGESRLALDHGTIRASILAPPRVFVVETRVGVATDLGCEYTLSLDREKQGRLAVTRGRVAFVDHGRESFVPAGAWCPLASGGAGVPRRDHAGDRFLALLESYDRPDCATGTIDSVLAAAEASDAITLWHLLPRVAGAERERVARRIDELIEVPADVPLARVLALEPAALDAWWAAIGMGPADEWRSGPGRKPRFGS
jgi:hypothetical protein